MKNVTVRIDDETIAEASRIYGAKVTGFQIAISGFFDIRKRSLKEVENLFSLEERQAILDNLNGIMMPHPFQSLPQVFWAHLEDGDIYEGLFSKWGIEKESFKQKIFGLTSAQAYFIQDAAMVFWQGEGHVRDLNKNFLNCE